MKNKFEIEKRMQAGGINDASFATVDSQGDITPHPVVTKDTTFQCASLSKPVFAYLVLKLIETNKTQSAKTGLGKFNQFDTEFNLTTPLYEVFRDKHGKTLPDDENPFLKKFTPKDREWAKKLTTEMVLSHRTGLHIAAPEPFSFQFEPGAFYAYSGPGIDCLQTAIEEVTGVNDLQILAQENIFRKEALDMPNSTYGSKPVAANSLKTTAEEYAKFIKSWINDDALNYAFFKPVEPIYSMMQDYFPKSEDMLVEKVVVQDVDRQCVTWGLGVGLVKDKEGQIIGAYHTGDMGDSTVQWRAGVGATIDPKTHRCIEASVYLTKSPNGNGHILAEVVLPDALQPALNYFFPTYGFAQNAKELDGTNYFGFNPSILKPDMQKKAYETKKATQQLEQSLENPTKQLKSREDSTESVDSTHKMFQQMNINPLSTKPELAVKTVKVQEQKANSNKPIQEVKEIQEDKVEDEQKFNPTPLSTSYDPYKS
ncbi:serine hydrolase domain-containing protein [Legionella pneumophila]|uniref:serine hydrolase domain-containing protein n=1 Tax=Legionella pneumophila TaxID=446 RepID=UPI003A4C7884